MRKNHNIFGWKPIRIFFATALSLAVTPATALAELGESKQGADPTHHLFVPEGRLGTTRIAPNVTSAVSEVFSHCPSADALVANAGGAALQSPSESGLDRLSDARGLQAYGPTERLFVDAETREPIFPENAPPVKAGYEFNGYWNTRYDESASARQYFDEELNEVGESKWHDLASGAVPLYAHWKYRIYLSTNSMDSSGNAVTAFQAGRIDAESVSAGLLRTDQGTAFDGRDDGPVYLEVVDGAPIQLPRVTGRTGYLDSGKGTDGQTEVNARAWGVRPGAYGWATGIVPLDGDGFTAENPTELVLDAANIAARRSYDGSAYFKSQDAGSIVFPVPNPATCSITLYMNWENRAKTYNVKLTSAYDGFTVSNAPTLSVRAVYDAPLLVEKGGGPVLLAEMGTRFFAPEKITGEGSERHHEYLFKGFRTQPNGLDGMQGEQLIAAKVKKTDIGIRAIGAPANRPFRIDAEAPELFAAWGRPKSTLTLDLNGGSLVGVIGKTVTVMEGSQPFVLAAGEAVPYLPGPYGRVPVRPGYAFKGYYTAATGPGAAFARCAEDGTNEAYYLAGENADTSKTIPANVDWDFYTHTTLYAHWEYLIDFRLDHEADCASDSNGIHATMTMMSGPVREDATDRYGNRYPLSSAADASASQIVAAAFADAPKACEQRHLLVVALAGVPVKVPVLQGNAHRERAGEWNVRQRDSAGGEVLATTAGNRLDGYFTTAIVDGLSSPTVPFAGVEPHYKTKTITAFAA